MAIAVAHKAIELGINWHAPAAPAEFIDRPRLAHRGDSSLANYLLRCTEVERTDLRSLAVSRVAAF